MFKLVLYICILSASIGSSISDFICYARKLEAYFHDDIFGNITCGDNDVEKTFDKHRDFIKECSVYKISVDEIEAFYKDICEDSTLFKTIVDNEECILQHDLNIDECHDKKVKFYVDRGTPCRGMKSYFQCVRAIRMESCNEAGMAFIKRHQNAMESYYSSVCAQLSSERFSGRVTTGMPSGRVTTGMPSGRLTTGMPSGRLSTGMPCSGLSTSSELLWSVLLFCCVIMWYDYRYRI